MKRKFNPLWLGAAVLAVLAGIGVEAIQEALSKSANSSAPPTASSAPPIADASSAKAFVEDIYSHYASDAAFKNWHPLDEPTATKIFDPSTAQLLAAANKGAGDAAPIDYDPFCGCQDIGENGVVRVSVQTLDPSHASALATIRWPSNSPGNRDLRVHLDLVAVNGAWRIHDLHAKNLPSLVQLVASAQPGTAATATTIDYGLLGKPADTGWTDIDPKFETYSPQQKLALFRHNERHPLQGDENHIVTWQQSDEASAFQRALFYSAIASDVALATPQDWKWVRSEELGLIQSSCDNRGAEGVLFNLSEQDCANAMSASGQPR